MRRLLLTLMGISAMMTLVAQGNGVHVTGLAVDAGTVTFNVSWASAGMPELWLDSAWVFVDYNNNGVMDRLPVTGATASAGTVSIIADNTDGVWIIGDARSKGSFNATVKLFTTVKEVGGACVYGSNYPPVGEYTSATEISFTGTPGYDLVFVGGVSTYTESSPYTVPDGYTIDSFTDKTGAPGIILGCTQPATYTLSGADVCMGNEVTLTLDGSQTGFQYQLYNGTATVGGVENGTGNPLTFTGAAAAGGYSYTVQTVDGGSERCDMPVSNVLNVTVKPAPTNLSLTPSTVSICNGTSAALTAAASSAASYSINNSTWQATTAFTVSPTSNTSYTLYVKNAADCSASVANAAAVTVLNPSGSGQLATACGCSGSLRNCSGTCQTYCSWTDCGLSAVSTVSSEGSMGRSAAVTFCQNKGTGWRLPTYAELLCMCAIKSTLPGGYGFTQYWAYDGAGTTGRNVSMSSCNTYISASPDNSTLAVKCVK
jgi:hypothetical protein